MKKNFVCFAFATFALCLQPSASFGQASGGNTGPSGGGSPGSSPTAGGGESTHGGFAPGTGTGGQGTEQPAVTSPSAGATTNSPAGDYPPASVAPTTSEPPSTHSGGPISPNS